MSTTEVRVIGGGLAGLVAAIECAERGARVLLLEQRGQLGGRARSTTAKGFVTNYGTHALYAGLGNVSWLEERGLLPPTVRAPSTGIRYVQEGRARRMPPAALLRALRLVRREPPPDVDLRSWLTDAAGAEAAAAVCAIGDVITFHHDSGSLAADFVWKRLRWVYAPPSIRYVLGGWSELVDRLERRARELGVHIELDTEVTTLPGPPVIVALHLSEARELLDRPDLDWPSGRAALLDVGLEHRRGDPKALFGLDDGVLVERFSAWDKSVAPDGQELLQAHVGIGPDEDVAEGIGRIEAALDAGFADWRERTVWRRKLVADGRTGAVDRPGTTWRDRPAIDQGGGVFLAGDMVAAEGFLSEVAFKSAAEAARGAVAWTAETRMAEA